MSKKKEKHAKQSKEKQHFVLQIQGGTLGSSTNLGDKKENGEMGK